MRDKLIAPQFNSMVARRYCSAAEATIGADSADATLVDQNLSTGRPSDDAQGGELRERGKLEIHASLGAFLDHGVGHRRGAIEAVLHDVHREGPDRLDAQLAALG